MGVFADCCRPGVDFQPSMSRMAQILWNWDPRSDDISDLDLPGTKGWDFTPWADTSDAISRVEFSSGAAPRFRYAYGRIGSITECEADNTTTPFRFEVVLKMPFKPDGCEKSERTSYVFTRILAFSSNALTVNPCPLMVGDPVVGTITAQYSGSNRAVLDVWRPADPVAWKLLSPDTVFLGNCTDFESWVIDWLPVLSGYPFSEDAPGENRILGARISPPATDPFLFIRERREKINEADKTDKGGDHLRGRVRFLDANATYRRPRTRSASKAPKSSSG